MLAPFEKGGAAAMLPGLMQDDFQLTLQYVLRRMRAFPSAG